MTDTFLNLSNYNKSNYQPGRLINRVLWYLCNRAFFFTFFPYPSAYKKVVLRLFGARIGKNVVIKPRVNIKYPWFLELGNNVWIGEGVWIDNLTRVVIEDNVVLSQGALLLCGNHNYKRTSFDLITGEIKLHSGVWICARAIVGPGVTAHSHAILSLGSVATADLEAWGIYRGNPATKMSTRKICPNTK